MILDLDERERRSMITELDRLYCDWHNLLAKYRLDAALIHNLDSSNLYLRHGLRIDSFERLGRCLILPYSERNGNVSIYCKEIG